MGKTHVYDKIMTENQKRKKHGNQRNFYVNVVLISGLGMEYTAVQVELMPKGAMASFTAGVHGQTFSTEGHI